MTDERLREFYNQVYSKDKRSHFLRYRDGKSLGSAHDLVLSWLAKEVPDAGTLLDFGCGEGEFLGAAASFSRRIGVDFSEPALETARSAHPDAEYMMGTEADLGQFAGTVDVVTSFGTLEHLDDPQDCFGKLWACVRPSGAMIVSCPSFLNIRGVIWITLATLFDVPMSLSDKHYLTPTDLRELGDAAGAELVGMLSVDHEVGQGSAFRADMHKRLTNALGDAGMDSSRVDDLVGWVERNSDDFAIDELSGVEMIYFFRGPSDGCSAADAGRIVTA